VISILVFVHEFGHFIAAKRAGVRVETFSIGMGPKLLRRRRGDTEYCLSGIPLGGYVKLKGENPDEEITGDSDELTSKSIPVRFSIFFAGPAMNALFAIFLVSGAYFLGMEMPKYLDEPPVIQWVDKDSPAEKGGIQVGDFIASVGGTPVETWEQAELLISSKSKKPLEIEVKRDGQSHIFTVVPNVDKRFGIGDIGIDHEWKSIVTGLMKGFPAEEAGVKLGDEIIAINGTPIIHWRQMVAIIGANPDNEAIQVVLLRDGQNVELSIVPKLEGERRLVGVTSEQHVFQQMIFKKYGLIESFSRGIRKCWELTWLTIDILRGILTRQVSAKTIGGPIMIAQMSGNVVRQGISKSLFFVGFVSLGLGIANLLPIPILDGGHIFLLLVEFLSRKPLSLKKRELAQKIGLLILIPIFLYVFYNDIARILRLYGF